MTSATSSTRDRCWRRCARPRPRADRRRHGAPGRRGSLRADLLELRAREALLADASRPDAVAKRHALGLRTARENIADLCDAGSFVEYGALAFAAQRSRRELDDLIRNTPADGMVTGIGSINRESFGAERSRAVVMAYDATVLAGTQGMRNHQKPTGCCASRSNRGCRCCSSPKAAAAGRATSTSPSSPVCTSDLRGLRAPERQGAADRHRCRPLLRRQRVAARLLRRRHRDARELDRHGRPGDGRGRRPRRVPARGDRPERRAVALGRDRRRRRRRGRGRRRRRRCLAFFQGRVEPPAPVDTTALRTLLPANRLRAYDIRAVVAALVDPGSALEVRAGFGASIVTALARIDGRPVGLLASDPAVLGGAIDADAADKAARFMQLCDAHALPLVSLIDTPGFMVGPEIEARGQVRHASRMFVVAAQLRVPVAAIVLRKAYGLGAMAMAVGGLHAPMATVAWPSGEFGAMGLEGAVELGYRKELAAAREGEEREALRERLVAAQYEKGKAIEMAATLEIDAVIDPADSRRWLASTLDSARLPEPGWPLHRPVVGASGQWCACSAGSAAS
jgi:acetyl-CoA carboxylase carboxyltransferase component